jgi:hypothetical protein
MVTPMYVLVERKGGQIFGFGLTPEEATEDFRRGLVWYDGPRSTSTAALPRSTARFKRTSTAASFFPLAASIAKGLQSAPKPCPRLLIVVKIDLPMPWDIFRRLRG